MEDVSIFLDEIESELICTASRSLTEVRRQAGRGREEGVIVVHNYIDMHISPSLHLSRIQRIKPYHHFPCISVPSPGSEHYRV
jgi:hypothetical protein